LTFHISFLYWLCITGLTKRRPICVTHSTPWAHCATSRKVAGSIPDGVTGIFHGHNPFGSTMALGSTRPLTEMSARNISCG